MGTVVSEQASNWTFNQTIFRENPGYERKEHSCSLQYICTVCLRLQDVWLGLSDGYSEGSLRWTDTRSLSNWANWEQNPNGATDRNCVSVTTGYKWKMESCTDEKYAFCMDTGREYKPQRKQVVSLYKMILVVLSSSTVMWVYYLSQPS